MTRILIVGAGPAGIQAAATLVKAGLRPVVIDEGHRVGGQIYRRPPAGFTRSPEQLYGSETAKARRLHALFDGLLAAGQIDYCPNTSVLNLFDNSAGLLGPEGYEQLPYDRLILATGASDRLVPLKGWQGAGVYTLGAAQIALKSQGVALGRKMVLAGSGPLLTLVAVQLLNAGAGVEAVLDTSPIRTQIRGGLRMALARPGVTLRGLAMRRRLGTLYHAGVTLDEIRHGADGPEAVLWRDGSGHSRETACDTVALGWHLRAETALADLAGADFSYSENWAQWLPRTDAEGRAGDALYLSGDGMEILGADAAELTGRIAARACLQDLGHKIDQAAQRCDLRRRARMQRFARGVAMAFPWPEAQLEALSDDTVICRCEGVSLGDLRATLPFSGPEANRVKSLGRLGMGRCQGRYCQLAGAALIAAKSGQRPQDVGRLRGQPPVRPAQVSELLRETS